MHNTARILIGQLQLPLKFMLYLIHTHITKPQTQWGSVHAETKRDIHLQLVSINKYSTTC
jgi:hypothetical protein